MITPNESYMRKHSAAMAVTAVTLLLLLIIGCDWVQNRIPDDYYDRDGSAPGTSGTTTEDTGAGASTQTTQGLGGQTQEENPEGQGGSQSSGTGGTGGTGGAGTTGGIGGAGGNEEPGSGGGAPAPQNPQTVTFEVPQGWYWTDPDHHTAVKGNPSATPDFHVPAGKIEVWDVKDGSDGEAHAAIQSVHDQNLSTCSKEGINCTGQPIFREITVGNVKVYAAVGQPEYAGKRSTYAQFSKGGKIVSLTIYDDVVNQMPLLEEVVTTINW